MLCFALRCLALRVALPWLCVELRRIALGLPCLALLVERLIIACWTGRIVYRVYLRCSKASKASIASIPSELGDLRDIDIDMLQSWTPTAPTNAPTTYSSQNAKALHMPCHAGWWIERYLHKSTKSTLHIKLRIAFDSFFLSPCFCTLSQPFSVVTRVSSAVLQFCRPAHVTHMHRTCNLHSRVIQLHRLTGTGVDGEHQPISLLCNFLGILRTCF